MNPTENMVFAHHLLRVSLSSFGKPFNDLDEDQKNQAETDAMRSLELERRILASPHAQGVMIPDSSLDKAVAQVRGRYDWQKDFLDDLAANGMTLAGLREALLRQLKVEAVLERVAARHAKRVEDNEVRTYFDRHPDQFVVPETRTARHILVTINSDFPDNTREAARARIDKIAAQLHEDSTLFDKLARRYSECPSALNGGLLGKVHESTLFSELGKALFRLREGEVSEIIETEAGFHIIACDAIHPGREVPFEEAEAKIREAMTQERRTRVQKAWVAALMGKSAAASQPLFMSGRGSA